jgi:hypothetical protein
MDINWLSIVLQIVAARFRMPARIALIVAAWLFHAVADNDGSSAARDVAVGDANARQERHLQEFDVVQSRDEYVVLGHAVVRIIVQTRVLIRSGER